MNSNQYLFLDFDGVICASIAECYVSSWLAYHRYMGSVPESISLAEKERYYKIRPYIRDAEDYLALHKAAAEGFSPKDQAEYDAFAETFGIETLRKFHDQFFAIREEIYNNDREYWLSLHPIFPVIADYLEAFGKCGRVHILSTKVTKFISIILDHHNIEWPENRLHFAKGREKLTLLRRFLDERPDAAAWFIEDQIDNLISNTDARITTRLASWGYLRDDWRKQKEVPLMNEAEFRAVAEKALRG